MTQKRKGERGARRSRENQTPASRKSLDLELQAYQRGKNSRQKLDVGSSLPLSRRTDPKRTETGSPPLNAAASTESRHKEESYVQGKRQTSGRRASDRQGFETMRRERRKRPTGRSMRSQGMERRMSGHRGVGRGQNVGTT